MTEWSPTEGPTCTGCGRKRPEPDRDLCFRCRVATVGFGWHGGGYLYGRNNFSTRTNAEFIAEHASVPTADDRRVR